MVMFKQDGLFKIIICSKVQSKLLSVSVITEKSIADQKVFGCN